MENRNLFTSAIAQLTRSVHGDLESYVPTVVEVTRKDPEFSAHLIAWNNKVGTIRDAKIALPVASLTAVVHEEHIDNSRAAIATLSAREFSKAMDFSRKLRLRNRRSAISDLPGLYLRAVESSTGRWDRVALQHRDVLKGLYAKYHVKPSRRAQAVLFDKDYPSGSVFATVANLSKLPPREMAGVILEEKIPFLVARGACGSRLAEPDVVLALISAMTPTELVTNAEHLRKLGVEKDSALRGAFAAAMEKAKKSPAPMKAGAAAKSVKSEVMKEHMRNLQETQLSSGTRIPGSFLILADKSGSMERAIAVGREVAGQVARLVDGVVTLVFFDTMPREINVTDKTMEQIESVTKLVMAHGRTSIGCGMAAAAARLQPYDGVIVISDGGHNTAPRFSTAYMKYAERTGLTPFVTYLRMKGEPDVFESELNGAGIEHVTYDLASCDGYSLPNIASILGRKPYSIVNEIMDTPLLKLKEVLAA